jgi:hypothetical protein
MKKDGYTLVQKKEYPGHRPVVLRQLMRRRGKQKRRVMSYILCAAIGPFSILHKHQQDFPGVSVAALPQGYALIPLTEELIDAINKERPIGLMAHPEIDGF